MLRNRGEIAPTCKKQFLLFSTTCSMYMYISLTSGVKLYSCEMWLFDLFSSILQICYVEVWIISQYFIESLELPDNKSQLYMYKCKCFLFVHKKFKYSLEACLTANECP